MLNLIKYVVEIHVFFNLFFVIDCFAFFNKNKNIWFIWFKIDQIFNNKLFFLIMFFDAFFRFNQCKRNKIDFNKFFKFIKIFFNWNNKFHEFFFCFVSI